ncbi:alpha/beta-hydrolase [Aspergillus karnatakaensis]|uniref:CocE/NonD family hydrolase n=1 Tax=Aspergillus karnatakaensis TaxID=1810916 RepID=UPI003CCD3778
MPAPVQHGLEPINPPQIGEKGYVGFKPRKEILPAGWSQTVNGHETRPLPTDILVEHDFAVKVRDGVTLYMDIYRPPSSDSEGNTRVPAIVAWSPFGKKYNGIMKMASFPYNMGVPPGCLSGLERFEGPDPAEFVPKGYAIVNVDARGAGVSEGSVVIMGSQEAEDGYDVIEALAQQHWCTGDIGMAGNSHLGIIQWFIAALQPPHLKAIAPWEALSDLYREQFVRGGIFDCGMFDRITMQNIQGYHGIESHKEMYRRSPLQGPYWKDKRVDLSKVEVPTYLCGSYSSNVHTMGSIRGWLQIGSKEKWLRWDPYQEWFDLWVQPESREELLAFFDKYLKGLDNGWEKTPRVRMSVLRFGDNEPHHYMVEDDFPIPRTDYKEHFLHADGTLQPVPAAAEAVISYSSEDRTGASAGDGQYEFASFKLTFKETTRLVGLPKAILYMSCPDHDDLTVYILLRKLDSSGKEMINLNIPWKYAPVSSMSEVDPKDLHNLPFYKGPLGILRAARRHIDWSQSMHPQYPFHTHDREEKIAPGEIVELEIGIWAIGIEFEKGETLSLQISGQYPIFKSFPMDPKLKPQNEKNVGMHQVHMGGRYASRVILPHV